METLVGKEYFQKILQKYISTYALKSVTHLEFKGVFEEMVKEKFKEKAESDILSKIDWEKWLKSTGQLVMKFPYDNKYVKECDSMIEKFLKGEKDIKCGEIFKKWHSFVKIVFLDKLIHNIAKINNDIYNN